MNKKIVSFSRFTLFLFLVSCIHLKVGNVSNMNDSTGSKTELIAGKWEIEKIDVMNDPDFITPSDTIGLITMFGTGWHNAEGKYFYFKENGEVETDILPHEITEMWNLSFEVKDKLLIHGILKSGGDTITSYTNVISLNENKMIWNVEQLLKITLVKV